MESNWAPAVWFPTIRTGSGSDVFTERLRDVLTAKGVRAEISWLPHRAEFAPFSTRSLAVPKWANMVHVNTWLSTAFVPSSLPVVATTHLCVHDRSLAPYKSPFQALYHNVWIKRLERASIVRANHVTAVSEYAATSTSDTFRCAQIEVIPNGVDLSFFRPARNKEADPVFRILYVGNWSKRKGTDLLGPIMKELGKDFELRYTSDSRGRDLGRELPPNCKSLGRLDRQNLLHAYQNSDVLIFPTRLEGFGLVAAEAMACGLPVIATRGSSIPEIVLDGKTGLLCTEGNVAEFSAAVRALAGNRSRCQEMGLEAEGRARMFDEGVWADKYVAAYQRAKEKYQSG